MKFNDCLKKVIGTLLSCMVYPSSSVSSKNESCGRVDNAHEPSFSVLKQQLNNWRWEKGEDNPFFIHRDFNPATYTKEIKNTDSGLPHDRSFKQALDGDRKCPKSVARLARKSVPRQMSMCPFYYELDYNTGRFPTTLITARCKCQHCVGSKKNSTCEHVFVYRKVLRKKVDTSGNHGCNDDGTYIYRNSFQKVNIGCSCIYGKADTKPDTLDNRKIGEN